MKPSSLGAHPSKREFDSLDLCAIQPNGFVLFFILRCLLPSKVALQPSLSPMHRHDLLELWCSEQRRVVTCSHSLSVKYSCWFFKVLSVVSQAFLFSFCVVFIISSVDIQSNFLSCGKHWTPEKKTEIKSGTIQYFLGGGKPTKRTLCSKLAKSCRFKLKVFLRYLHSLNLSFSKALPSHSYHHISLAIWLVI